MLCCEPDVTSLLCPATYCVGVSMYDYDCLILYEWFSLDELSMSEIIKSNDVSLDLSGSAPRNSLHLFLSNLLF